MRTFDKMKSSLLFSIVFLTFIGNSVGHNCCGDYDGRIIGGELAKPGDFKGVVLLRIDRAFCGSSLIDTNLLLTAAHCFYDDDEFTAENVSAIGGTLSPFDNLSKGFQEINATKIIVHPEYDDESKQNDIALVFLERPFKLTDTFQVLNISKVDPVDGESCQVAGWGRTKADQEDSSSPDLLKVEIKVIPMDLCNGTLLQGEIPDGSFCAGELDGTRDTCQGDSGGGLICGGVVRGIVSWGEGCGTPDKPGAYVNVNRFKKWIEETSSPAEGSPGASSLTSTIKIPIASALLGYLLLFLVVFHR